MNEDAVKKALKIRAAAYRKGQELSARNPEHSNMLQIIFDHLNSQKNSEESLRSMSEEELENQIAHLESIITKINEIIELLNPDMEKIRSMNEQNKTTYKQLVMTYLKVKAQMFIAKFIKFN